MQLETQQHQKQEEASRQSAAAFMAVRLVRKQLEDLRLERAAHKEHMMSQGTGSSGGEREVNRGRKLRGLVSDSKVKKRSASRELHGTPSKKRTGERRAQGAAFVPEPEPPRRKRKDVGVRPGAMTCHRSLDGTALLAMGILLEEAGREVVRSGGDKVLSEGLPGRDESGGGDKQPVNILGVDGYNRLWSKTKSRGRKKKSDFLPRIGSVDFGEAKGDWGGEDDGLGMSSTK